MRHFVQIAAALAALLSFLAPAQAEPVPPPAKSIKAHETAILLVDFQANFVSPEGAWYGKFAQHYAKTRMLERIVELVGKARAKGVRSQVSGFAGTGLSEILRAKGIKNVAVAGFTSDVCVYATVLSAYDLGFHVYALREGMVGFYDAMAEQMVNFVYPMWSQVVDNDEFDKMVEASPTAARKASAQ